MSSRADEFIAKAGFTPTNDDEWEWGRALVAPVLAELERVEADVTQSEKEVDELAARLKEAEELLRDVVDYLRDGKYERVRAFLDGGDR